MQEEWVESSEIDDFPGSYLVSNLGRVKHPTRRSSVTQRLNDTNTPYVSLKVGGRVYSRSVAVLVAKAFLAPPPFPHYNTPIHLDGDRTNVAADNLAWRPRWYAIEYHKQFTKLPTYTIRTPIENINTGEVFSSSFDAAIFYGILDKEVAASCLQLTGREEVPVLGYTFRIL